MKLVLVSLLAMHPSSYAKLARVRVLSRVRRRLLRATGPDPTASEGHVLLWGVALLERRSWSWPSVGLRVDDPSHSHRLSEVAVGDREEGEQLDVVLDCHAAAAVGAAHFDLGPRPQAVGHRDRSIGDPIAELRTELHRSSVPLRQDTVQVIGDMAMTTVEYPSRHHLGQFAENVIGKVEAPTPSRLPSHPRPSCGCGLVVRHRCAQGPARPDRRRRR